MVEQGALPGEGGDRGSLAEGLVRALPFVVAEELLLDGRLNRSARAFIFGDIGWVVARDPARRQQDGEPALLLRAVVGQHRVRRAGEPVEGEVGEVAGPAGGHSRDAAPGSP